MACDYDGCNKPIQYNGAGGFYCREHHIITAKGVINRMRYPVDSPPLIAYRNGRYVMVRFRLDGENMNPVVST